jgi:hypothetical protein
MCTGWLNKNIATGRVVCRSAEGVRVVSGGEVLLSLLEQMIKALQEIFRKVIKYCKVGNLEKNKLKKEYKMKNITCLSEISIRN